MFSQSRSQGIIKHIIGLVLRTFPDSKVHGANMGPIWGRQDPGGPHAGPMNFAIWDFFRRTRRVRIYRGIIPQEM